MITAILVFILILIAIAIFYFGLMVGSWSTGKQLADAIGRALIESDLSSTQKMELLDKIKEYAKEKNYDSRQL
jgi:Flp pilus assembly protein TadG